MTGFVAGGSAVGADTARAPIVTVGDSLTTTIARGDTVRVPFHVIIAEGYHVQANPAGNEFLIPLELSFEATAGITIPAVSYPEAVLYRLEGTEEDLKTYHGATVITVTLAAAPDASPGRRVISGSLHFQACDHRRCFFPTSIPVSIAVIVAHTEGNDEAGRR